MLQDLLYSQSDEIYHYCSTNIDMTDQNRGELRTSNWMKQTFLDMHIDPNKDLFLPLILYADMTGTDQYQR